MESQKIPNSQSNLEKKEWSWKNQLTWFQTIVQNYSHQGSMVVAQKQKYRSIEQDRKPGDKSTHIWAFFIWQRRQEYTMGKNSLFNKWFCFLAFFNFFRSLLFFCSWPLPHHSKFLMRKNLLLTQHLYPPYKDPWVYQAHFKIHIDSHLQNTFLHMRCDIFTGSRVGTWTSTRGEGNYSAYHTKQFIH